VLQRKSAWPIITLLTDFGFHDSFVGEVKGALLSGCRQCNLVDITHSVPAYDVEAAAYILGQSYNQFPPGTIHLAVVDPGVGSSRRPIILTDGCYFFVGPDNGLFTPVITAAACINAYEIICTPGNLSATFHGRDLFAPAAAALARGQLLESLGIPISDLIRLKDWQATQLPDGSWKGKIVWIDHFGNLITNLPGRLFAQDGKHVLKLRDHLIEHWVTTYSQVHTGLAVLKNSHDFLEVIVANDSAARVLSATQCEEIYLITE